MTDRLRALAVLVLASAYIFWAPHAFMGYANGITPPKLRKPQQSVIAPHESALADFAENDRAPWDCEYRADDTTIPRCPDPAGANAVLWGDSMAGAWSPAMRGATVIYSRPDCPPLIGYVHRHQAACHDHNEAVAKRIAGADTVYIASRWDSVEYARLATTLDRIAPTVKHVVVIGPTPEMRAPVPKCLRSGKDCGPKRAQFDRTRRPILAAMYAMAAKHPNVSVVDPTDYFCDAVNCPPVRNGVALYWDRRHVSVTAARGFSDAGRLSSAR